jgi:D-xylose transport system ATP-binding protein
MLGEPKMVMLDEPTAALGVAQTEQVLNLVRRLKDNGLGVILISHNLGDVFQVADRITVLRLGRNNGDYPATPDRHQAVVAAITGAGDAHKEAIA